MLATPDQTMPDQTTMDKTPSQPSRANVRPSKLNAGKVKSKKAAPSTADINALVALFNQGLYAESTAAAIQLTQQYPQHGFGWKVLGALQQQEGRLAEATLSLVKAVRLLPGDAEAHYNLGNCYYDQRQLPQARASYQQAVKINPRFVQAQYNLGSVLKDMRLYPAAELAYKRALTLDPTNLLMRINLGQLFKEQGKLREAESAYLDALEIDDQLFAVYFDLSAVYQQLDQPEKALLCLQKAMEIKPDYTDAYFNLGLHMQATGNRDEAIAIFEKIVTHTAHSASEYHASAYNILGQLHLAGSNLTASNRDQAIACFRAAIEANSGFAAAYNNLGIALKDSGHFTEAKVTLQRALALDPKSPENLNNLAIILKDEGSYKEAEALYRQALAIAPDYLPALCNLAMALDAQERFDEAKSYLQQAIALKPDFHEAYNNLGLIFKKQNRLQEAVEAFKQALRVKPDYKDVLSNLGSTLKDQGQLDEAQWYLRKALEVDPYYSYAFSNLLFNLNQSEHVDAASLFAEHKLYGERFEAEFKPWQANANNRDLHRTLRVGFVSADFRTHSVAFFIEPVLEHLSKSAALSLYAYSNSVNYDQVSHRLRQYFHRWEQVSNLSDSDFAAKIRADGIDILIDLSGHTAGHRLLSFARKPAPIQASWLGYLGTTGLTAMDYYFTDSGWMPSGQLDDQFTEKLVQLPAYAPFQPEAAAPPVNELPALSNGYLTFGSFNRVSKLSKTVIALWAEILRQLPDAKMLLGALAVDGDRETLTAWFAHEGIASERLIFHERSHIADYLALHQQVDICLDTFPHNGGTTTWHAVWMGVPTLTLAGKMPQSRISASILGQVGLDDFVVDEAAQYLQQALYWADHLPALAQIRSTLRERFAHSPAGQPATIALGLEQALRTMWQRWCQDEAPTPLTVNVEDVSPYTGEMHAMQSNQQLTQSSFNQALPSEPKPAQQPAPLVQSSDKMAEVDLALGQAMREVLEQGILHQNSGELALAEQLYQEILKVQPLHAAANHRLGVMQVHIKGVLEGLPRLEQAVSSDPHNEQYWVSYIDALVMGGNITGAASAIELGREFGLTAETAELLAASFVQQIEQTMYAQPYQQMSPAAQNAVTVIHRDDNANDTDAAVAADTHTATAAAALKGVAVAKFLIISSSYTDKSGGIAMLHELCNSLNKLGYQAAMVLADNGKFTITDEVSAYGPGLQWYALKDAEEYQEFIDHGIVIYPEVITGNPLNAKHVVRYMLNSEGYVTGNKMEASAEDFILSFSTFYHDHPHAFLNKLPLHPDFNTENTVDAMQRTMDVTYIGKGYSHNKCFVLPNSLEVTREWPKTKAELALLFKHTRYFYTWDLRSQTNTDALLCGAIPVFLSHAPYASFDALAEEELANQLRASIVIDDDNVTVSLAQDYQSRAQHYKHGYMEAVGHYENQCALVTKQILHHFSIPGITIADEAEMVEVSNI